MKSFILAISTFLILVFLKFVDPINYFVLIILYWIIWNFLLKKIQSIIAIKKMKNKLKELENRIQNFDFQEMERNIKKQKENINNTNNMIL